MISCQKATELISKQLDYSLSLNEKAQLLLHLADCCECLLFEKQIYSIHNVAKEFSEKKIDSKNAEEIRAPQLSPELKSKILRVIRTHLKNSK
jgi:hypothetical protein